MHQQHKQQRGSALISALLLMSIVTLLAVGMLMRQDLQIRRTETMFAQERLMSQAAWVELWGIQVLNTTIKQLTSENNYITLDQVWALPLEEFQREGVWISGEMIDLQSRFNINNVSISPEEIADQEEDAQENPNQDNEENPNPPTGAEEQEPEPLTPADLLTDENRYTAAWVFARLTENLGKFNAIQARGITESLLYWIMPDSAETDDAYLKLPQPYRAAHQPLWSVSELRLVLGMTNDVYNAIAPYLMVLSPTIEGEKITETADTKGNVSTDTSSGNELIPVNINTTSPELLAAILAIEISQANNILALRPYFNEESLHEQITKVVEEEKGGGNAKSMLAITSNYFLVRAQVRDDRRTMLMYSILHRDQEGKVTVLRRIQGEM